jgi:hypothetical protein
MSPSPGQQGCRQDHARQGTRQHETAMGRAARSLGRARRKDHAATACGPVIQKAHSGQQAEDHNSQDPRTPAPQQPGPQGLSSQDPRASAVRTPGPQQSGPQGHSSQDPRASAVRTPGPQQSGLHWNTYSTDTTGPRAAAEGGGVHCAADGHRSSAGFLDPPATLTTCMHQHTWGAHTPDGHCFNMPHAASRPLAPAHLGTDAGSGACRIAHSGRGHGPAGWTLPRMTASHTAPTTHFAPPPSGPLSQRHGHAPSNLTHTRGSCTHCTYSHPDGVQ